MKKYLFTSLFGLSLLIPGTQARALSCLPVDMYIDTTIGNDDVVIFTAKSLEQITSDGYTAEVLAVTSAQQGYVEEKIYAYHTKDETWGYLCNNGPKEVGSTGMYIAERGTTGKYSVTQRLDTTADAALITSITATIKKADVVSEVVTFSAADRINQIMTTIKDLLHEIMLLISERAYWQNHQ